MEPNKRLLEAAAEGNIKKLRAAINDGADMATTDKYLASGLNISSSKGHLDFVKEWLNLAEEKKMLKEQLSARNISGSTPLHVAASQGNVDVVEELLRRGADRNAKSLTRQTPLHYAHADVVEMLADGNEHIDEPDICENTPLHIAARQLDLQKVKILIDCGANPKAKNEQGQMALHLANETFGAYRRYVGNPTEPEKKKELAKKIDELRQIEERLK